MSIVERAVEKAQSGTKAPSSEVAPVPAQPGSCAKKDPLSSPVPQEAHKRPSRDGTSLTMRDLKPIVQLDLARLRAAGRLPPEANALQIEEEIRRIKWPLLNAIEKRNGASPVRNNVVLVTSALAGEGKTFTSLNLALSIVRDREMRVILVDGDVARPGLTPALGLEDQPGLNDVLEDTNLAISAVTYQTDVEGLFVVPAGKWHDRAPEFFAGSRMPQVIDDLIRRVGHGVVILDSPPLLATNEAQVVTRYVGQVLVVVRADTTDQRAVKDAIALIDAPATVSAVLNGTQPSLLSSYYGQRYYGYSRGKEGQPSHRATDKGVA